MKKVWIVLLLCISLGIQCFAVTMPEVTAPCAALADENGNILLEKNAHEKRSPASVTKIMTMLLAMEAIDAGKIKYDDMVTASEHACSMGGTQIWLEPGEQLSVTDMLKCVAVASANDCAVALGEHIAGSEEAFVKMMNDRAKALGMEDTHFVDCTGLTDDEAHVTSAHDIVLMSAELLKHPDIKKFTTIWMDTVRNGEFGLASTNKMLKKYPGATGLKTGFTRRAMYCISATAAKNGMELIAVIMGAESIDKRTADASALLNCGFANYQKIDLAENITMGKIPVRLGARAAVEAVITENCKLIVENGSGEYRRELTLAEELIAPVEQGEQVGILSVYNGDTLVREIPVLANTAVERLGFSQVFLKLLGRLTMNQID